MRKVEADFVVRYEGDGLNLILRGFSTKVREIAHVFGIKKYGDEAELIGTFKKKHRKPATANMQAYLYGHLAPFALDMCQSAGWNSITTKEAAVEFLKEPLGFCDKHVNQETGEVISVNYSLSFRSKAEREESSAFIEKLMMLLLENNYPVITPDEYKKGKRYEGSTKVSGR